MAKKKLNDIEETTTAFADEAITGGEIDLITDELAGQLRDYILTPIRNLDELWEDKDQFNQELIIDTVTDHSKEMIRKVVELIAANGRKTITAELVNVAIKDGIKCTVNCRKTTETINELGNAQGNTVLLVVADSKVYEGEGEKPEGEPDQLALSDELSPPSNPSHYHNPETGETIESEIANGEVTDVIGEAIKDGKSD